MTGHVAEAGRERAGAAIGGYSWRSVVAFVNRRLRPWVSRHRWLLLVLLVAFGLRFAWLLYARPHVVSDFGEYLESARTLREHGRFGFPEPNAYRLPAYPILLAALMVVSERVV